MLFQSLFEHSSIGIIITDTEGLIVRVNAFASRVFGYEPNEIIGKPVEILLPAELRKRHEAHRDNFIKNPKPRAMGSSLNLKGLKRDGSIFAVEVSLSFFESEDKRYIVSFVSDVEARNQANEKLHKLYEDKVLSELKSRFVAMASYEFLTPLKSISNAASLISRFSGAAHMDKREKYVHTIQKATNQMTFILNEFLSLKRLDQGSVPNTPTTFLIKDLLEDVVDEMKMVTESPCPITVRHHDEQLSVTQDADMLHNLLVNLLSNALKYSPEGKTVRICTSQEDHQVVIAVTDQGLGIPADEQAHIYDRFYRATNATSYHGHGLGLTIVRHYLDLMGGKIEFVSALGKGSTFTVKFPQKNTEP